MTEKQTGIKINYQKSGNSFPIGGSAGIHIYRILQEALNNVVRHSGAREAWVRLAFLDDALRLEMEDHGAGFIESAAKPGIGLEAMRERADLLNASIEINHPAEGGTLIRLRVPRSRLDSDAQ
jgi:signal transduction histidine kinase